MITWLKPYKMPHIISNLEYMIFVYGFCKKNATADVGEYCWRLPHPRIPSKKVFTRDFDKL